MRCRIALFCMMLTVGISGGAQALVTDLSHKRIEIRYSFNGADLILFGAVGTTAIDAAGQAFDVVIVVRGPDEPVVVRQKDRVGGIWVNQENTLFPSAPGYYAVAATRPLKDIAAPTAFSAYGIGFDNLPMVATSKRGLVAPDPAFRSALFRIRAGEGLYRQEIDTVSLLDEGLFRTDVHLPARVPVGNFIVETFIFQDGVVRARNRISMTVDKEGFERAAYTFAHEYPLMYGLVAVIVALLAGWSAGFIGRRK